MACFLTNWKKPVLTAGLMAGLTIGAAPALAQDGGQQIDLTNAPVDLHEGTCADFVLDPWDEIGRLNLRALDEAYDPYAPDVGYGVYDDDAFLSEDLDDDGVLDDDEDLDDDGIIDFGVDADDDDVLDEDEIVAEGEAFGVANLADVYEAHGEVEDTGLEPIFNQPNIIAVHASSENYESVVACGDLTNVVVDEDDEEVVVGLTSVDGSGVRGYAVFWNDGSLIGTDPTQVDVFVFDDLPTERDGVVEVDESTPTP